MRNGFTTWLQQMSGKILDGNSRLNYCSLPSLVESVEYAREEWLNSRAYFETVSDPDLVDHAIYMMEAAEKKYVYLLKKAREARVVIDF